jgi:hypothetical protein
MAAAFFAPPRIRREKVLAWPQGKLLKLRCRQFAARLSHAVNVRSGCFFATPLKRLTFHGISHRAARHWRRDSSPHAAQVFQATMDFEACAAARFLMRRKRFTQRSFSSRSRARRVRTAFGLPQRA